MLGSPRYHHNALSRKNICPETKPIKHIVSFNRLFVSLVPRQFGRIKTAEIILGKLNLQQKPVLIFCPEINKTVGPHGLATDDDKSTSHYNDDTIHAYIDFQ